MGQNDPFWVPKTGVVTGNFWSLSGGVVETDCLRRADFSVGQASMVFTHIMATTKLVSISNVGNNNRKEKCF